MSPNAGRLFEDDLLVIVSGALPAARTVKVLVTLGQHVSTFAPTTLVQLKPDARWPIKGLRQGAAFGPPFFVLTAE
jgi:hypothetical protein